MKKKKKIQDSVRKVRAAAHVFQAVGQMLESQPKYFKDPSQSEQLDPRTAYRNNVYQGIKNALSLAVTDDGNPKINVDNIYPFLRALGLNPQSELIVDLVREASIETFGDINPKEFERVVLSLVKDLDKQLWTKRLDEKEHLRRLAKANEAKIEAEKQRLDQAGFQKTEEKANEWEEYERQKQLQEVALQREMKEDELYDNTKMAFRLIDADEDGVISAQDMYQLMMALGNMMTDDELFGMINMVDLDCDGKITFEDFKGFLLLRSGDESLVHSPEAVRDNNAANQQADIQANEITAKSRNTDIKTAEVQSNEIFDPAQSTNDSTVGLLEADRKYFSDDEKQALDNKKRTLLYWNRSQLKTSSTVSGKPPETIKASVTPADDKVFLVKSESSTVIKKETQAEHLVIKSIEESGDSCQLQSIRENGEHSNVYESLRCTGNTDIHARKPLIPLSVKTKRQQFSRKNHSDTVKSKFTDSFGSSDEKIMYLSSGITDQPSNSDISEVSDEVFVAPQSFTVKRSSQRSSNDSFVYDEDDDEDMIEAHYVQESLSRVSSTESLNNLNELSKRILPYNNHHIQSAFDRTQNFVRNHIELEPTVEKLQTQKQIEERLNRAFTLQKTILKRSLTAPSLTLHTSNREQLHNARPQLNVIACSHINIDLMCESPPKADITPCSQFSAPLQSVRTSCNENEPSTCDLHMNFADINDTLNSRNYVSPSADSNKWPMRPLTRPRPSNTKILHPPPGNKNNLDTGLNVAGIAKVNKSNIQKALPRRAASAAPFRQSFSCSTSIQSLPLMRPQTASMPYTTRRKDSDELFEKLLTEPLSNSDELYPNKSLLTAFHHGFKSFWPIGRKINVIKNNLTLELNSYSRAIERNEFPFRGNKSKPIFKQVSMNVVQPRKPVSNSRNGSKLEMDIEKVNRPTIKQISLYITPNMKYNCNINS